MAKLGQMALDTLGYDEIMNRAEEQGWVQTVPDEQAQATVDKKFIGDVSLSPTPQPPVRPPPPPPTGVITRTATKRVMTKVAPPAVARVLPTALARAAPTAVLPGLGEMIAVGTVVVTLIGLGVVKPEDVLTSGQVRSSTISGGVAGAVGGAAVGGAIGAAATPTSAATTTAQPAATVAKPRKYPNQTCEEDERIRLNREMHDLCDLKKGFAVDCNQEEAKLKNIPCSRIKLSLQQRRACMTARWEVQNKCFGGKPDGPHKDKIDQTQTGIDHCELLEPINCAKGHPMAEK